MGLCFKFVVWLLIVSVGSEGKLAGKATCESTRLGAPARVTCHYRDNIVETREVSAVSLLRDTGEKKEPDDATRPKTPFEEDDDDKLKGGKLAVRATCESTGLGAPARVTCHYRENVVEARGISAVSLLRDTGGKEEKVMECDRFENNGFDCLTKAGYKLNGTISDQMIINIPRSRPEHQGTYYCELRIQHTEFQMGSCDLQNKGKLTGKATCESTKLGAPARVTCHYRDNILEAREVSAVSLLRDTGEIKEKVVECDRFENNGFDCLPKAGYKLNGTISDQMIINIPRSRREHQGTYYCELRIQQSEIQMESCNLQYNEPDDATRSKTPFEEDDDDKVKGGKLAVRATCESTGLGAPARVTCHYRENVVEARGISAVSLLRDTGGKEENVMECDRFENNGFDCLPKTGYKLNGTISDQMIINIPRARPEHQGTYYCEVRIQHTEIQMGSCDLQYKGKLAGRATCESTKLGAPARVTCHYRDNILEAREVSAVSLLRDTGEKKEKVVECDRFENNGFDCVAKAGYKLNGTISDQISFNIPRSRREHQGTYYCELRIQQTEIQMESCNLQYNEPDDATESKTPFEEDDDDKLKGVSDNFTEEDTGYNHITLVFTVLVALLLLSLLFNICMSRYAFSRACQNNPAGTVV